jgi:hypothetical protein
MFLRMLINTYNYLSTNKRPDDAWEVAAQCTNRGDDKNSGVLGECRGPKEVK